MASVTDNYQYLNTKDAANPLDIHPVAGNIGAEIRGITLSDHIASAEVGAIRAALVKHKVVFFRDQAHFDGEMLGAFAALLGQPYRHPTVPGSGDASVTALEAAEGYSASSWHTDVTFVASYPRFTILQGIAMPAAGGDTLWANTATAYDCLPEDIKQLMDKLWTYHDNRFDYPAAGVVREESGYRSAFSSIFFQTEHPAVHVHPDSGERNLIGGSYLKRFVGFDESVSLHLRALIQDHVTKPENTVRWRWQAGDIVIWDNAATQHRAIGDFGTQRRSLRRATAGSITPVSIEGRASRIVKEKR
jgi:alpha-ketoglutarate-dependent taurine dioxygenase